MGYYWTPPSISHMAITHWTTLSSLHTQSTRIVPHLWLPHLSQCCAGSTSSHLLHTCGCHTCNLYCSMCIKPHSSTLHGSTPHGSTPVATTHATVLCSRVTASVVSVSTSTAAEAPGLGFSTSRLSAVKSQVHGLGCRSTISKFLFSGIFL